MSISDVTETFSDLTRRRASIDRVIWAAVADSCGGLAPLLHAVHRLIDLDESNRSSFRYLPMALCGAMTGAAEAAIPVVALSRIWWTGAETLDDITDGEFDSTASGMTPRCGRWRTPGPGQPGLSRVMSRLAYSTHSGSSR